MTRIAACDVDRPSAWRYRSRTDGVDITARVVLQDGLLVVVAVSVRHT